MFMRVQVPSSAPKNQVFGLGFFIHCESNGISSRFSVYIIAVRRISSTVGCICFHNDDMQGIALVICNFYKIDDIHDFVVIASLPPRRRRTQSGFAKQTMGRAHQVPSSAPKRASRLRSSFLFITYVIFRLKNNFSAFFC